MKQNRTPMTHMIETVAHRLARNEALMLEDVPWPRQMRILTLAPHPDDFDSIAVTLRFFRDRGDEIRLTVLNSSGSGVEDSFCRPPSLAAKGAIREHEQRASCRLFGLTEDRLVFLRLAEDESGNPRDDDQNYATTRAHVQAVRPDLVFLPHGNDPNPGHRLASEMLFRFAVESDFRFLALLNRDPKTLQMRSDLYTFFGEEDARWKAELLRCHQSQHQRNINTRGYGFDERILCVNRQAAAEVPGRSAYAEVFEFRAPEFPKCG
jgi:LmbE family N-acetylglucosaminyl deacetylase